MYDGPINILNKICYKNEILNITVKYSVLSFSIALQPTNTKHLTFVQHCTNAPTIPISLISILVIALVRQRRWVTLPYLI